MLCASAAMVTTFVPCGNFCHPQVPRTILFYFYSHFEGVGLSTFYLGQYLEVLIRLDISSLVQIISRLNFRLFFRTFNI